MSAGRLRVGIVGTGGMAAARARAIAADGRAAVAAVVSRSRDRAAAFCAEFGGPAAHPFESLEEALDARLDALCVCTPNPGHGPAALAALERGLAVLVEYPLAPSLQEAKAVVDAAARCKAPLHVGLTTRRSARFERLRELLPQLGRLRLADRRTLYGRRPRKWYADKDLLGSVFVGAMHDLLDEALQLFGPAAWAEASLQEQITDGRKVDWDLATMTVGFAGGGIARFAYGRGLAPPGLAPSETYVCADGYLSVEGESLAVRRGDAEERHLLPAKDSIAEDTRAWISAAVEGRPSPTGPEDALAPIALGEAAARAASSGQREWL